LEVKPFFVNFPFHQKKGGIHDIYRYIMEAFGYFRVTGLVHKNNLRHKCRKPLSLLGGFFEQDCVDLMDEQDGLWD
jgi:hypothetical protein